MKGIIGLLIILTAACTLSTQNPTIVVPISTSTTLPHASTAPPSTTTRTAVATTKPVIISTTRTAGADLRLLFVGNSHTSNHEVPAMVETLLESDRDRNVIVEQYSAPFLRNANQTTVITAAIAGGGWDIVVIQGQEISQSHSVAYSQEDAVELAGLAVSAGARVLLFSEWPRRNINETAYIEGIYDEIAAKSGAEVVPVGRSWDFFLSDESDASLWASDGNHSSEIGAFLAAATIAYAIAGPKAELTTEPGRASLLEAARLTIESYSNE